VADDFDLERFVRAQDEGGTYAQALGELQRGRKASHWMWFVFPQLAGLGRSGTARYYAIRSLAEAQSYLAHPVLGDRLRESSAAVAGLEGRTAEEIFGAVDAVKLRSSMTLFRRAAPEDRVFADVLDRFFEGQSDPATERLLAHS
jgi:uncharacterized protein (DUF1810 family)